MQFHFYFLKQHITIMAANVIHVTCIDNGYQGNLKGLKNPASKWIIWSHNNAW